MIAQLDKKMIKLGKLRVLRRFVSWFLFEGRPLTTKGRKINSLVFSFYKASQFFKPAPEAQLPVFIVGTGRAGTTILGKLLALHKHILFLNEPKALWHFAYGEEDIIGSYSSGKANLTLTDEHASFSTTKKLKHAYSVMMKLTLSKQIVDKYPELVFRLSFVEKLLPNSKFIAIIRDGVDTCSSVEKWSQKNGVYNASLSDDWWGRNSRKWKIMIEQESPKHEDLRAHKEELMSLDNHQDRAAVEWILSMRALSSASISPEKLLVIRYENLCKTPGSSLTEILDFIDLDYDETVFSYGNEVLKVSNEHESITLAPFVSKIFKETLVKMGYEESSGRVIERVEK